MADLTSFDLDLSVGYPVEQAGASTSDASFVEQAKRGNSTAFEALVRRYYRAAHTTALALVGNTMDAEDVCQDAFVRALQRLEDCHSPDRFKSWLLKIVRNRAHNFREYQQVRAGTAIEEVAVAGRSDPGKDAVRSELRGKLETALSELTEMQRQVVLLYDMEGCKHDDIAKSLGVSIESSRQHLFVARKRLQKILGADIVKVYLHE